MLICPDLLLPQFTITASKADFNVLQELAAASELSYLA